MRVMGKEWRIMVLELAPVRADQLWLMFIATWCSASWVYVDGYIEGDGLGSTEVDVSCQVS